MPTFTPSLPTHWRPRFDQSLSAAAADLLRVGLDCPVPVAHLLSARGVHTLPAAQYFLRPSLDAFLSDAEHAPTRMLDMDLALPRILDALRKGQPILIYGDYDVDGTTAIVLLKAALERVAAALETPGHADIRYHVPHRVREGYGIQTSVLAQAAADGVRLVISVDTGIRAFAEAAEARTLGLDLIVTDHHLPDEYRRPDCLAVINPAQPGCQYPNKHLCGAAVAFRLAHGLLLAAAPLTQDPAEFRNRAERVLIPSFLKLVAIATVADAVPLTGENRVLAALGLAALAEPVQPGLRALMEIADLTLNRPPTAAEVAFRLAPRINAAGRMDVATDVVELFLTRDPVRAQTLAGKLDALNRSRRETETDALASIDQHLATLITPAGEYPPECLILDHPGWHRGVLGILASRVVERTHRPVLVVTHADGVAHGSGRSIPGFHLLDALTAAEGAEPGEGLFQRFGGHAHAVGFSLPSSRLAELRARISVHAARWLTGDVLTPVLHYDAELSLDQIAPELFAWVERLAPFGLGNPEPVFLIRNAILGAPPRAIKSRHVCLEFRVPTIHEPDSGPGPRDVAASRAVIHALGWSNGSTAAGSAGASSWAARCSAMGLVTGSAVDLLVRLRQKTGPYANERLGGMELELQDLRVALPVATGEL